MPPPRAAAVTNMRLTSAVVGEIRRTAPHPTARPSCRATRNAPRPPDVVSRKVEEVLLGAVEAVEVVVQRAEEPARLRSVDGLGRDRDGRRGHRSWAVPSSNVTRIVNSSAPRTMSRSTASVAFPLSVSRTAHRSSAAWTSTPLAETMRSPVATPPAAAGDPRRRRARQAVALGDPTERRRRRATNDGATAMPSRRRAGEWRRQAGRRGREARRRWGWRDRTRRRRGWCRCRAVVPRRRRVVRPTTLGRAARVFQASGDPAPTRAAERRSTPLTTPNVTRRP